MTSTKSHQRTSLARQRTLTKGHSTYNNTIVKSVVCASNISKGKVVNLNFHCMKLYPNVPTFLLRHYHRRPSRKPGTSFYLCQVRMNIDAHPYNVSEGQTESQICYLAVVKTPSSHVSAGVKWKAGLLPPPGRIKADFPCCRGTKKSKQTKILKTQSSKG